MGAWKVELTKTFEQFIKKYVGEGARYYDLQTQGGILVDFEFLPEEEKLKFTVEQAEKIENDEFVIKHFHYITVSEMKINNKNANEKLCELAKKIDSKNDNLFNLNNFLIYYFSKPNSNSKMILSKFNFNYFRNDKIKFLIKYKEFFPFINDLLKQKYKDFECEDFLLEIKQNPQNFFDYLAKKKSEMYYRYDLLIIYFYIHMKFEEQTPERFGKLSSAEKNNVIIYAENNKSINITKEHVDLIIGESDFCEGMRVNAQKILDFRNKQAQYAQNVQAKEIEENKSNKICEVIKLFFATLFSLGSSASIIIGAIALASLLTLPFSPLILVCIGVPVLIIGVYFFGKSVKNLRNLILIMKQPNVKEENDDNSAISKENNKDENNISRPEFQEEEEDKSEIDFE